MAAFPYLFPDVLRAVTSPLERLRTTMLVQLAAPRQKLAEPAGARW